MVFTWTIFDQLFDKNRWWFGLVLLSSSSSYSPKNLPKSSQPTLESSSIQTTELIVKCHTIL